MLDKLTLRDFAIIDSLEFEPGRGLCLLSGETGAGKSILVEAIGLLSGQRAETEMVRNGRSSALIEGVFTPSRQKSMIGSLMKDWGIDFDDEIIVRRKISREGRSLATVNGSSVTIRQLQELGALLVQVNGQHQGRELLDEDQHLNLLDGLPQVKELSELVDSVWRDLDKNLSRLRTLQENSGRREQRLDTIDFQLREIEQINPDPGEEDELHADLSRLQNAGAIAEVAANITELFQDEEQGVSLRVTEAGKLFERLAEMDPAWREFIPEFEAAASTITGLVTEVERTASLVEFDPQRLEDVLQRVNDLERLKKKYGPTLEDVTKHRETLEKEFEVLKGDSVSLDSAEEAVKSSFKEYLDAAHTLSGKRQKAAKELSATTEKALRPLAMEKARFKVELIPNRIDSPSDAKPSGLESARFLLSANPGEPLLPLSKIASGGELSRTLLALLTAANPEASPDCLVFDEIDVGIGGRPAEKVGISLKKLIPTHQVFCITHLPQIAAYADWHAVVRKNVKAGKTIVQLDILDQDSRVGEIARMLAGEVIAESAIEHARNLISQATGK